MTGTAKPLTGFASTSRMPKSEGEEAERKLDENIKLANERRGRIIVAITPRIIRPEEDEERILGTP